jgi:hypothetical protein
LRGFERDRGSSINRVGLRFPLKPARTAHIVSVRTNRANRLHRAIDVCATRLRVRQVRVVERPRSESSRIQCCVRLRIHTLTPARSVTRPPIPRNDRLIWSVGLVIPLELCRAVQFCVDPVRTFELCHHSSPPIVCCYWDARYVHGRGLPKDPIPTLKEVAPRL